MTDTEMEFKEYNHPSISWGKKIYGRKLLKGEIMEEGDLYPSCNGKWNEVGKNLKGQVINENPSSTFFFLRPKK